MTNCLFCNIIDGKIPAKKVDEDEQVFVFDDINPQAPHHKLIVPKKHISTLNDATTDDKALIGHMIQTGSKIAKELNIAEDGYRLVFNCNAGAGQTVFHIHAHLLGGRIMTWPPG